MVQVTECWVDIPLTSCNQRIWSESAIKPYDWLKSMAKIKGVTPHLTQLEAQPRNLSFSPAFTVITNI